MSAFSKIAREPLVHFVLIGAAVFGLYALVSGDELDNARDRIVVTEGRVQQLAQVFTKTWQRPPSPEELRGLVDAYIKEEVYYREAIKRGPRHIRPANEPRWWPFQPPACAATIKSAA
jgi:hypothetical protein